MEKETAPRDELGRKTEEWLSKQGYPLEYYAAEVFRAAGFRIFQGQYVRTDDKLREIDVVAQHDKKPKKGRELLRISFVVECKWSKSHPWVVFTSSSERMMKSAVISQAVSSELGEAILWANPGNPDLHSLRLFDSPQSPGFGGRQALSDGDKFYDTMRAVSSAAGAIVASADRYLERDLGLWFAEIAFPVVVIEGDLFAASYNAQEDKMSLRRRTHVRCHWRGDANNVGHTTVDIVTKAGLRNFVARCATESATLTNVLWPTFTELRKCREQGSFDALTVHPAPRGLLGGPRFVARVRDEHQRKVTADEEKSTGL